MLRLSKSSSYITHIKPMLFWIFDLCFIYFIFNFLYFTWYIHKFDFNLEFFCD